MKINQETHRLCSVHPLESTKNQPETIPAQEGMPRGYKSNYDVVSLLQDEWSRATGCRMKKTGVIQVDKKRRRVIILLALWVRVILLMRALRIEANDQEECQVKSRRESRRAQSPAENRVRKAVHSASTNRDPRN